MGDVVYRQNANSALVCMRYCQLINVNEIIMPLSNTKQTKCSTINLLDMVMCDPITRLFMFYS